MLRVHMHTFSGKLEYCCGVETDGDPVDVMFR